jgi:NADH dehydrogenase FAD-containing subunit
MKLKMVVLGAGFGGLELSTLLSEALGERLDLTLIDERFFYFGFSARRCWPPAARRGATAYSAREAGRAFSPGTNHSD